MKKFKMILLLLLLFLSTANVNATEIETLPLDVQALIFSNQGDNVKALSLLDKAIKNEPKNATYYNKRGRIKEATKDFDGAMVDYSFAIKLKPDYASPYYNRGMLNKQMGKLANAGKDLFKYAELNPSYGAYTTLGNLIQEETKNYDVAIEHYTKAISYIQPEIDKFKKNAKDASERMDMSKFEVAYYGRGMSYFLKKDFKNAIPDLNRALYYQPYNPDAYIARGLSKAMLGNKMGAFSDLGIAKQQYEKAGNKKGSAKAIDAIEMVKTLQ